MTHQGAGDRRIALVPPYSERFTPGAAGAFSLFIAETAPLSRYREGLEVYGQAVEAPFAGAGFAAVEPGGPFWLPNNRRVAWSVGRRLRGAPPALVEVFNRPEVFEGIARQLPTTPMVLHLGNDPLEMRRARARAVRQRILDRSAGVWCCSQYICDRFLDGLTGPVERVRPLYVGAVRDLEPPRKEPLILYVGRMIDEKGVAELAEALAAVLQAFPDWKAAFVGAGRPGQGAPLTPYEAAVHARLAPLGDRIAIPGFLPAPDVAAMLRRAAILVVPSKWQEPLGRTAIEGLAAGCAVIASRRGGLPEIVGRRGVLVDEVSADSLATALQGLMADPAALAAVQKRAWDDFPFGLGQFVQRYDDWRAEAMASAP